MYPRISIQSFSYWGNDLHLLSLLTLIVKSDIADLVIYPRSSGVCYSECFPPGQICSDTYNDVIRWRQLAIECAVSLVTQFIPLTFRTSPYIDRFTLLKLIDQVPGRSIDNWSVVDDEFRSILHLYMVIIAIKVNCYWNLNERWTKQGWYVINWEWSFYINTVHFKHSIVVVNVSGTK